MRKNGFTVRDWIYVAVFGALWGCVEITLGGYLHTLFPPLADTLLTGIIMAGIGAIIALIGRYFVAKRGAVLCIGLVTALLKVFSLGGVIVGPLLAIIIEAALMELALLPGKSPARAHYMLAGALAVSWNFFHKFAMMRLLYGQGVEQVFVKMVEDGSKLLGLDMSYALLITGVLLLLRIVVGAAAGWLAWDLSRAVARRLVVR